MDEAALLRTGAVAGLRLPAIDVPWEEPPPGLGDLAFATFLYAKEVGHPPNELAARIAAAFRPGRFVRSATPAGGYVNIAVDLHALLAETFAALRETGEDYGSEIGDVPTAGVARQHEAAHPADEGLRPGAHGGVPVRGGRVGEGCGGRCGLGDEAVPAYGEDVADGGRRR